MKTASAVLIAIALALLLGSTGLGIRVPPCSAAPAAVGNNSIEERPANFIFLLDVSGSMLYKSEMVTAGDGTKVFLFEGLRQALKQIVEDHRLLGTNSTACIITFGTQVAEKSAWPHALTTEEQRQKLVQLISSPDDLQADKHGDTYMGAAIEMALDRANKLYSKSDPCTTTFVVMLTDGWDEPPPGGGIKVKDSAAKFVRRAKEIQSQLGVRTWQALVVGLQNLPDRKAGTTTARELANLLDGQFIDVTKQAGGTVSEKIFSSLKQTVESLKGEIKVAAPGSGTAFKDGVLQFGTVDGNGVANASFPLESRSCYEEQILSIQDVTPASNSNAAKQLQAQDATAKLVSQIPPGAITIKLSQSGYKISPQIDDQGKRKIVSQPISVVAQAHNNCPAGHYVGTFAVAATAKSPQSIKYAISVPGRLVCGQEELALLIKKPGVFWAEPTTASMEDSMKEVAGAPSSAAYTITVTPESARMAAAGEAEKHTEGGHSARQAAVATIDAHQINEGKPVTVKFDTTKSGRQPFRFDVYIPANQVPGRYKGLLDVAVSGATDIVAPSQIPYEITVEPSPWEKVAPIAIPIFLLLIFVSVLWLFFWLRTLKR